jgi:hypothetical protein
MDNNPAIQVDDLKEMAEPFLTDKTKAALAKKELRMSIVRANEDGSAFVYAQCAYIGKKVPRSKVEDGVKFVAEKINLLGEAGEIVSSLSHFIKVDLYSDNVSKEPECVVVCYVHVPVAVYDRIQADLKTYGAFTEGGIPE